MPIRRWSSTGWPHSRNDEFVALTAGTRFGTYEVVGLIGAGGMGEVYRGRDTRLGRDVALKILPEQFATDPDRLARFRREAQVLASLAETFPGMDWERNGDYFFSRVIRHGQRRAEEMREAAATVREAGLDPLLTAAIAERQQWVADLARAGTFADAEAGVRWREHADGIPADAGTPAARATSTAASGRTR